MSEQEKYFTKIRDEIISFDVDAVKTTVLQAVEAGIPANKLVDIMSEAMEVIGKKYETGEYFVTELIIGGETMKEAIEVLQPYLTGESSSKLGAVVVATVAGDIHDIGKNIFVTLLATAGFNVIDLGVDIGLLMGDKIVDGQGLHLFPGISQLPAQHVVHLDDGLGFEVDQKNILRALFHHGTVLVFAFFKGLFS